MLTTHARSFVPAGTKQYHTDDGLFAVAPCARWYRYSYLSRHKALCLSGLSAGFAGLRIAFQRANLISQFPDAFTPYTQFGCTLREPYAGQWTFLTSQKHNHIVRL